MTQSERPASLGLAGQRSTPASLKLLAFQRVVSLITHAIEKAMFGLASLLLVFMVFALFIQVLFRYVIKQPVPWTEEGARFALVWFSIAAATIAAREGQHFVFRWATLILPNRARYWLRRVVDVFVIAVLGVIFVESLTYLSVVANQTAPGTGLNMRLPYAGITVGSGTLIAIYFGEVVDALLAHLTGVKLSRREAVESSMYVLLATNLDKEATPQ